MIKTNKDIFNYGLLFSLIFILISIPTIYGYDSDFAFYVTSANMLAYGMEMYNEVYDHKPPLYHYILVFGAYLNNILNTKLLGFFVVHFTILGLFYIANLKLLKEAAASIKLKWSINFDILLFSFLTLGLLIVPGLSYGNLNGGIVYFATLFEIIAITRVLNLLNTKSFLSIKNKDLIALAFFCSAALLARIHFAAFVSICIFILIYRQTWVTAIKNLLKFVLYTFAFFALGALVLSGTIESFYSAIFSDNLLYTEGKKGSLFSVIYYSIKINFFVILLTILSVTIVIFRSRSIKDLFKILIDLFSNKSIYFLLIFAFFAFFVILLTKPGPVMYKYYGFIPIFVVIGIVTITALSSKKFIIFSSSLILFLSMSQYVISFQNVVFKTWNSDILTLKLQKETLKDEIIFTADFNSWLYLMTDNLPPIKAQFLHHLIYPTKEQKLDAFNIALKANPKFITFSSLPDEGATEIEEFIILNQELFTKEYKFIGNYNTPYHSEISLRLWEKI
jgi:hypothetical protein